ncbi:MAG TPA: DUF2490 domain-containing protein [Terriglobales bacterium]|nr:DUF2490 domain-containing protein [Terriglobales bacterium]
MAGRMLAGVLLFLTWPTLFMARSQDTVNEFWPEADAYLTLSPKYRLFFMAAHAKDRDSGAGSSEFSPNFDITLKPIPRMKFRSLDPERQKYLTFRVGYRYLTSEPGPNENRMIMELTPRFPLPKSFVLADRSRIDLRWRDGFSWRYRNRLSVDKEFKVRTVVFDPYMRGEAYYDFTASSWTRFSLTGGVVVPICQRVEIEPSFERQNILGSTTNHVNGAGLTFSLYF